MDASDPSPGRWRPGRGVVGQAVAIVTILAVALAVVATREPARTLEPGAAVERYRQVPAPTSKPSAGHTDGPTPSAGPTPSPTPAPNASPSPTMAGSPSGGAGTTPTPGSEPSGPTSAPPPTAADGRSRPAAGVYTFTTEGYDRIDAGGGRQHDYPSETSYTVRHTECGTDTRWDVLEERWDEGSVCGDDGALTVVRLATYREFLGYGQLTELVCDLLVLPPDPQPGQTWTGSCSNEDTEVSADLTVVGREALTIGDSVVEAIHIRSQATFTGATRGEQRSDRWLHPDTGLELRGTSQTDATSSSPFGEVRYEERFERQLTSLEPRR